MAGTLNSNGNLEENHSIEEILVNFHCHLDLLIKEEVKAPTMPFDSKYRLVLNNGFKLPQERERNLELNGGKVCNFSKQDINRNRKRVRERNRDSIEEYETSARKQPLFLKQYEVLLPLERLQSGSETNESNANFEDDQRFHIQRMPLSSGPPLETQSNPFPHQQKFQPEMKNSTDPVKEFTNLHPNPDLHDSISILTDKNLDRQMSLLNRENPAYLRPFMGNPLFPNIYFRPELLLNQRYTNCQEPLFGQSLSNVAENTKGTTESLPFIPNFLRSWKQSSIN